MSVDHTYEFPASFAQTGLWLTWQMAPNSVAYTIPVLLKLSGDIDESVLESCLAEIVARHEVLRTTFEPDMSGSDAPKQIVRSSVEVDLPVVEVEHADVDGLIEQELKKPFDLGTGPLFRPVLFRTGPTQRLLVISVHHAIFDGWSMGLFAKELSALYAAYQQGAKSPLDDLSLQYADYAVWQRESAEQGMFAGQLDYWQKQLAGAPDLIDLPTDRPRPAISSFAGAQCEINVPPVVLDRLKDLARSEGATLYMVFIAACSSVLSRWARQTDICIGAPVAGRARSEVEDLIGCFVNTIVLRSDVSGDPTFRELLADTRTMTLAAYDNQDYPFERLVKELSPHRSPGHNPLFQVAVVMQNLGGSGPHISDVDIELVEHANDGATFDLSIVAVEERGALSCVFEYSTDLFDASTMHQMAAHLGAVLAAVADDPDVHLRRVDLLSAVERARLMAPPVELDEPLNDVVLTSLLERQAAARADSVAVVSGDLSLTYFELNTRSNQLARVLRDAGAGPDVLVGVAMERSLDLVVTLMAVLKSGAAYLPLDPSHPPARIDHIVGEADPLCVLTDRATMPTVSQWDLQDRPLLSVDQLFAPDGPATCQATDNILTACEPHNLAYVMYTSGSTGQPKGVEVAHESVVQLIAAMEADIAYYETDVWTMAHSYAFDLAVWEMWGPLATGGRLVLVPIEVVQSPLDLAELLIDQGVTVLNQTPTEFRELTAVAPLEDLKVRIVELGAEALSFSDIAPWFDRLGPRSPLFLNTYGPTEATVTMSLRPIVPADMDLDARGPIGDALRGRRLYVLDDNGHPTPDGIAGELYLGGCGLARGYFRKPALTAERFVPNPFGSPGSRLYRSGDLVRQRTDGELEFIGRVDNQVKIRGFRIELGEIQVALERHATVREAAVVARHDGGEPQLVAYIVPVEDVEPVDARELRRSLAAFLPSYMIPTAVVPIESLPTTVNGKLDAAALPAPDRRRPQFRPPKTSTERMLCEIWCDVLGLESISVDEDFYGLGGHSLGIATVAAHIRQRLQVNVPLQFIMASPTVSELACLLDEIAADEPQVTSQADLVSQTRGAHSGPLVPLHRGGSRAPLFLVHPIGGSLSCYRALVRALGDDQPVYGFSAVGLDGGQPPIDDIEALAASYLAHALEAVPEGPIVFGGWSLGGVVAYEMARQLQRTTTRQIPVVMLDSYAPKVLPCLDEVSLLVNIAHDWAEPTGQPDILTRADLRELTDRQRIELLLARARTAGVVPAELDAEFIGRLITVMRANDRAVDGYEPHDAYSGTVVLLAAIDEMPDGVDVHHGFDTWTSEPIELRTVRGNHYSIMHDPDLSLLAGELRAALTTIGQRDASTTSTTRILDA